MSKPKLLKLIFVDDQGEPYHECQVSPKIARDMLTAKRIYDVKFDGPGRFPIYHLTYAEVARQRRAVVGKFPHPQENWEVLITTEN